MFKKPYLNVHKNLAHLIIWRQSLIKVYFCQFGGQNILDCTPVGIRKDWLIGCTLVQTILSCTNLNRVMLRILQMRRSGKFGILFENYTKFSRPPNVKNKSKTAVAKWRHTISQYYCTTELDCKLLHFLLIPCAKLSTK